MERLQEKWVLKDLKRKMVFVVGPRQVGKTTLAKNIAKQFKNHVYLNYDSFEDRKRIKQKDWLPTVDLLILDELHKMPGWKNYLKGLYDTKPATLKILVTGSARLDTFRRTGDSLVGRFFTHHLFPLSLAELHQLKKEALNDLDHLLERGGFPEPFLAQSKTEADRWRKNYMEGLVRNDILDFENIHNLKTIEQLVELLRERVGSPLSYSSLSEDLGIAPNTVRKYIHILESLYIIFRVSPVAKNIARSLSKSSKVYFFDTGLVRDDDGVKWENTVANALYKHCLAKGDYLGKETELRYLRTKEGKEVDFCLTENGAPHFLIECKWKNDEISSNLSYFSKKYKLPGAQWVRHLPHEYQSNLLQVRSGIKALKELML